MRRSVLALSFAFLGTFAAAAAAQGRPISLSEKCSKATQVVVGSVTQISCRWQGNLIVTDITLAPTQVLKGVANGPLTFTIPGGQIGNVKLNVSEVPKFAQGQEVLVFLRKGVAVCDVYGWQQGKYTFVNGVVAESPGMTRQDLIDEVVSVLAQQPR